MRDESIGKYSRVHYKINQIILKIFVYFRVYLFVREGTNSQIQILSWLFWVAGLQQSKDTAGSFQHSTEVYSRPMDRRSSDDRTSLSRTGSPKHSNIKMLLIILELLQFVVQVIMCTISKKDNNNHQLIIYIKDSKN